LANQCGESLDVPGLALVPTADEAKAQAEADYTRADADDASRLSKENDGALVWEGDDEKGWRAQGYIVSPCKMLGGGVQYEARHADGGRIVDWAWTDRDPKAKYVTYVKQPVATVAQAKAIAQRDHDATKG
jgi:hypothetical protein